MMADWYRVAAFGLHLNLQPLMEFLLARGVAHRVVEERGQQVLWVADENIAGQLQHWLQKEGVHDALERAPQLPLNSDFTIRREMRRQGVGLLWLLWRYPVTLVTLLLGVLGALLVYWDGSFGPLTSVLSFQPVAVTQNKLIYHSPMAAWQAGELWRLLTPIFLHFGPLHIIFNGLWIWEFGRRLEQRFGSLSLLTMIVFIGVLSNMAQFIWAGPSQFGGLSGVLYGLLGVLWIHHRLRPSAETRLPGGIVGFMLVWLVLCMSGVVSGLTGMGIANAAHVGGLIVGIGIAGLLYLLRR